MKKIICDTCGQEMNWEGSHNLEVGIEKERPVMYWFKVTDRSDKNIDICKACWEKLFNLVKPILTREDSK